MQKTVAIFVSFLIILTVVPGVSAQSTATLTVNANKQVSTFSKDMLGFGIGNWDVTTHWNKPLLGQVSGLKPIVKEITPGIIRYAGGNWVHWIGWQRTPQPPAYSDYTIGDYTYSFGYGTDEMADLSAFAKAVGADVMIEVNVADNNPAMWADMVKYTNIDNNFDFKYWEIGNENDFKAVLSGPEYAKRFTAYKNAMKAVDPTIEVVGGVTASVIDGLSRDKDGPFHPIAINTAATPNLEWLSYHWYENCDAKDVSDIITYTDKRDFGDVVPKRIRNELLSTKPNTKIMISEINVDACHDTSAVNYNHITATFFSDAIGRLAYSGVNAMTTWLGYSEVGYAMIKMGPPGQNLELKPAYYTYLLYSKFFGTQMMETSTTNNVLTVWAAKDPAYPNDLKLIVTNISTSNVNATINLAGFSTTGGDLYQVKGDSTITSGTTVSDEIESSINGVKLQPYDIAASIANIPKRTVAATGSSFTYTFPAMTANAIVLHSSNNLPTVAPTATPTPKPTSTPTPIVTAVPLTVVPSSITLVSETPFVTATVCMRKPEGDANCDTFVNLVDLEYWTREFLEEITTKTADFNAKSSCKKGSGANKFVCLDDLQIWTTTYLNGG